MKKRLIQGKDLTRELSEGSKKLADFVGSTMGPRGRNVILRSTAKTDDDGRVPADPIVTKDGVTVARFFDLEEGAKDVASQIIRESAIETNKKAGDGTTTATVLANAIFQEALSFIEMADDGYAVKNVKEGVEKAKEETLELLKNKKMPIKSKEDIKNIATISSNGNEEIGEMIALTMDKVGKNGSIVVEKGGSHETEVDYLEGFQFPKGFRSPRFINDKKNKKVHFDEETLIMVTDHDVDNPKKIYDIIKKASNDGRPFVLVASSVQGQALSAFIMNAKRGTLPAAVVTAPHHGKRRREFLQDLAVSVGANFICGEDGDRLKDASFDDLGGAESVEITNRSTTIIGGAGKVNEIKERIEGIEKQIEREDQIDKAEQLQDRVTRLSSGAAVIRVGGETRAELDEKKHRVDDAIEAVTSAQEEGVLPGGGVALLRLSRQIDPSEYKKRYRQGVKIFKSACEAPVEQMSKNSGIPAKIVKNKILSRDRFEFGFNFMEKEVMNLYKNGVIDPAKVTMNAVKNAVSSATTLLISNNAILEEV